jgi:hypothetical protein
MPTLKAKTPIKSKQVVDNQCLVKIFSSSYGLSRRVVGRN